MSAEKAWYDYRPHAPYREFVEAESTGSDTEWASRQFVLRGVATLHGCYRDRRLGWGVPLEFVDEIEYSLERDGDDLVLHFHCQQISHQHEPHHIYADVTHLRGRAEGAR